MSMIVKDKIQMLKSGYPTVSDKYDVTGAVLSGNDAVAFGDVVQYDGGYFKKAANAAAITDIAGIVVATNVKLNTTYGGDVVETQPGEAFNLLLAGSVAVDLDSAASVADIKPNSDVYVILATGKLTTSSKAASGIVKLPNTTFTGTYELHGTTVCAEILVK